MMDTRRQIFLHFSPLAEVGGCEVNCLRLIGALSDHDHRVVVFDEPGTMSKRWAAAGAKVEHLAAWRTGPAAFETALSAWASRQEQPAGIFYWSSSRLSLVLRSLRGWDAPWVVHLGNPVSAGRLARFRNRLLEFVAEIPASVTLVACSQQVALSYRAAPYFRRFPVQVIYNPVPASLALERQYRPFARGGRFRAGMVARLDSIKDHGSVLGALAKMGERRRDLIMEFAGDGILRAELENQARSLGVSESVRFLGFTDIDPLLAGWDFYVHATTVREGMGTAVAEAMMAGLPCIASDLPVMREVCGDDALYFRPGDASSLAQNLVALMEDHAQRRALGVSGRARALRTFAIPQVASAYLDAVSGNSGRSRHD